ncbi:vacuolar membrane protein [Ceratobasidium sp. AG-Ba]|nr:vacuolar membrane protein [Ceratobasidium sp. AG-Ba]QRW01567.1 vacuolar membrane protein [Ceratobasidium sp. AG-Ba]
MCFNGPQWKREEVQDHKFDFIDTRDYHSKNFGIRVRYIWVYVLVVKAFLVYMSDIFTATTMLSSTGWTNQIYSKCGDNCAVDIQFDVAKWIFVGCIIFSFLLLAYEAYKAKKIIASRDISYAFTNVMANTYYSLRSYDHFCFFCQIENSTKKKDDFAFFIFFTFKGWKRLLLADGPRQSINALILYSFWQAEDQSWDPEDYINTKDLLTSGLFLSMMFTVLVFLGSVLLLIVAAVCYVPLLCYIQGNLKEYCCHKVDKRIAELIKRKNKLRVQRQARLARKEAAGDFSHLKDKNGQIVGANPQPTLPDIDIDDELAPPTRRVPQQAPYAGSYGGGDPYWQDPKGDAQSMYSYGTAQPPYYYNQNGRPDSYYDGASDYGSTAHLAPGPGQVPPVPMGDPRVQGPAMGGQYGNDPRYGGYPEYNQYPQDQHLHGQYGQQFQAGDRRSHGSGLSGGLAYDDPVERSDSKTPYPDNNPPPPHYERRGGPDGHAGGYAM